LLFIGQQFYFECQFHDANILNSFKYKKIYKNSFKQGVVRKQAHSSPTLKGLGFPAPRL
jgi:hypothetical protein